MIEKKCLQCGKIFNSEKWKKQKYCSFECGIDANRGITYEDRKCAFCGKIFKVEKCKKQRYCSFKCGGIVIGGGQG